MPLIPRSGSFNSGTLTPNPFAGGFMNFFLSMATYASYGILIIAVCAGLAYLCFNIFVVSRKVYSILKGLVKRYGPSIREWWAGRLSQSCGWLFGLPARTYGWSARCLAQVRGWFAARNAQAGGPVRKSLGPGGRRGR
ncbi:hypothetical protein BV25DRAFT_1453257 [Artomyces pyxidatus]|uniref:Uncharacterized protein n=1 Tax=Artomyces pyxidatus TaxID=48021 RepID=A0ACB8SMQ0_9AGAM|nr:hypothetical protein BV25DRAFT_1453257 [Artomyces pyxidatus]